MKYNRPQATASWGTMAKDWEKGIDYDRLHKQRLARAQDAIRHAGLGGVIAFNFDNIRYITATHIGEWARDKFMRYALCPVQGPPFLWDPAPPAKRLSSPWIADNVAAPISTMQGGLPPQMNVQGDFAKQIKKALVHFGIEKEPIGIDLALRPGPSIREPHAAPSNRDTRPSSPALCRLEAKDYLPAGFLLRRNRNTRPLQ